MRKLIYSIVMLHFSTLVQAQIQPYDCVDTIYHVYNDIYLTLIQNTLYDTLKNEKGYCNVMRSNDISIWLLARNFHLSTFVQTGDYRAKKAGKIYYDSLSDRSQSEKDSIAFYYLEEIHEHELPHLYSFRRGKLGGIYPYIDGYYAYSSKKKNDEYDEYIYKKGRKFHHASITRLVLMDTSVCSFKFGTGKSYRRCQKKKMYRETKKYFDAFVSGIILKEEE